MSCYQNIDMIKTGRNIESMIRNRGYDVKYIQSYLQLSCPQPIYRWFKGQVLPTVDHLYMLSKLLKVHMEDLLIQKQDDILMLEVEKWDLNRIRSGFTYIYKSLSIARNLAS